MMGDSFWTVLECIVSSHCSYQLSLFAKLTIQTSLTGEFNAGNACDVVFLSLLIHSFACLVCLVKPEPVAERNSSKAKTLTRASSWA